MKKKSVSVNPATSTKNSRKGFVYQVEYCPNPECILIHTRTKFPEFENRILDLRTCVKNAGKPGWSLKRVPTFYKDLAKIRGLKSASPTDDYSLFCEKANSLFTWTELLPKIMKVIQLHIAGKRTMTTEGDKHPSREELAALRRDAFVI